MKYIDLHCDSLYRGRANGNRKGFLSRPELSNDLLRMRAGNCMGQFFSIFFPRRPRMGDLGFGELRDEEYLIFIREFLVQISADHPEMIRMVNDHSELTEADQAGQIGAFLTFEDGRVIQGSMENLRHYHRLGIRLISLTWNDENCFGYPNSPDPELMQQGLKEFGKEAIPLMNELGMIIDVSHLSDGGFWDVLKYSKKPAIASHSNARTLTPHPRNLTDDMIRALADQGGISGLNFAAAFLMPQAELDANPEAIKISRVADMVRHLNHMKNLGGEDFVALGSDFDGISCELEIKDPTQLHLLDEALEADGWGSSEREKFWWRNADRIIKEVLG